MDKWDSETVRISVVCGIRAAIGGLLLLIALSGGADAHHAPSGVVYPLGCCNSAAESPTGDCAPVDDLYVTEEADGYHITLPIGAHPQLKTKGYSEILPYSDPHVKQPIDGSYHICLSSYGTRFCFFPKPGAV